MSQRSAILKRLEEAGDRGIHSFQLLDITPRYAAHIHELINDFGYAIESVPERSTDAVGVRYTLQVGCGADTSGSSGDSPPASDVSAASSPETVLSLDDTRRRAPTMYDPFSDAA